MGCCSTWRGYARPAAAGPKSTSTDCRCTDAKRRKQAGDSAAARTLAEELGRLSLALEQASAYIAHRRLGFAQYLADWQSQREKVLRGSTPA